MNEKGSLYICATPIGNLQDITLRVLETLKSVDLIACEDTRKTLHLLNHFSISKPVTSYFEYNKGFKGEKIIRLLQDGKNVALVSDAGMPGISDPGYELIGLCISHNIPYTVLPGAVAAITGLVLSGLPTNRFTFEGFVPRYKNDRLALFYELEAENRTMIFYESPHRLLATLESMELVFGDRQIAVTRELTKKFEEVARGTISDMWTYFQEKGVKGEFVLILQGAPVVEKEAKDLDWALARVQKLQSEGLREKEAIRQAATEGGLGKREVYNRVMAFKKEADL